MHTISRRQFLQRATAATAILALPASLAHAQTATTQTLGSGWDFLRLPLAGPFEVWSTHRVSLDTDVRNEQSRTAIAALGARFEGVIRGERIGADITVRDSARFSIVVDEWPEIRAHLDARLASHP